MTVDTIIVDQADDCISVRTDGPNGPSTDVFDSDSDVAAFVNRLLIGGE